MNYEAKATATTPAHVIFLIDSSQSMTVNCYGQSRMVVVHQALTQVILQMIAMSTKVIGGQPKISPRFRIAVLGYNEQIHDPFNGFVPLDKLADLGVPLFTPEGNTNTALGFQTVDNLLQKSLPNLPSTWPAPLVCHLTDGECNVGGPPNAIVDRIKSYATGDGPVLIENIFVRDSALRTDITDIQTWQGVRTPQDLQDQYAIGLFHMSSVIPEPYIRAIQYAGFSQIQPGVRLLFPGTNPELIKTALAVTGSSGMVERPS